MYRTSRNCVSLELLERRSLLSASYTLLSDINPGNSPSLPEQFQSVNGKVLFLAYSPTQGQMLFSTDGTRAGTAMIADLNPNPQAIFAGYGQASIVIGNEMYFAGTDYAHGTELWKTDGTAAGTQLVGDLNPGLDSSNFTDFTNFNGKLAFEANNQLWISDGTPGGTQSLGNLNPAGVGATSDHMAVMGDELFFFRYGTPNASGHNTGELWKTDGTMGGTQEVTDLSSGSDGRDDINSTGSDIIAVGGTLYFAADDGTRGWELYSSDGTSAGTSMVADLAPAPAAGTPSDGSYPSDLLNVNGTLFFTAASNYGAPTLYKLNSSGQPQLVSTMVQSPQNPVADGSEVYFTATDSIHGRELWKSDGTSAGTQMVSDINPGVNDSSITGITVVGANIFFSGDDGIHGPELWMSNGTGDGTVLYASSNQGVTGSSPGNFTALGDRLILQGNVIGAGEEPLEVDLPATAVSIDSPITSAPIVVAKTVSVTMKAATKSAIDVKFSDDVSASFGRASFSLIDVATGLRIDPSNVRVAYNHKTNIARITFHNKRGNVLMTGHYRLRLASSRITDSAGDSLAADMSFGITISKKKS